MALPKKLKFFALFNDGENYLQQVPELVLPKLARKMEEWRAGGMDTPIMSDMGGEPLSIEWTLGGMVPEIFAQFGALKHDAIGLRFAGSYQSDDSAEVMAVEVSVRGRHSEIDSGTSKAGDNTTVKVKSELSYYKLVINNKTLIEIDVINMVYIVDGVDLLKDHRSALGI